MLDEVRGLLRLVAAEGEDVRSEARTLVAVHVADIRAKVADLQAMELVLTEALCECEAGRDTRCLLIEVFSEDAGASVQKFEDRITQP
jgi:MerR family mercuric resistance operon transcriptional regulator